MRTIIKFVLLPIILSSILSPKSHALAFPAFNQSEFTQAPCMIDLPPGIIEGQDVVCGYVTVPENHASPEGDQIQLSVLIIKSHSNNPRPDPLFIAQGGPGGSTIDTYTDVLLTQVDLVPDRDIVLFDQRGTLYSKPNLMCPEINQMIIDTIEQKLPDEQLEQLELKATIQCHNRLIEDGVNLSAYNSLENAADINAIREALGYDQINLYGVSYGTLLALHTMRNYPEILRSVILDAVVPPQSNFILEAPKSIDRSFTTLFVTCLNDPVCNKTYPNLEEVFYELVDELEQNPAIVPMTDPDSGILYQTVVDGDTFQWGVFQMLYATSLIPALPRMIYDAKKGEFGFFGRVITILLFDRTTSYGMYYSTICAEDADFVPSDYDLNNIHPQIAETEKNSAANLLNVCKTWGVEPLADEVDNPVSSIVPTLILSGEFDPITPPVYGDMVSETLQNSFKIVFPAGGHGQALEGNCQNQVIKEFIDNPKSPPNTDCIEEISKPEFFTPQNILEVPGILRLLNLENNTGTELLFLVISSIYLLTSLFVFPTEWFFNRLKSKRKKILRSPLYSNTMQTTNHSNSDNLDSSGLHTPQDASITDLVPRRFASLVAIINGITLMAFLLSVLVTVIQMVQNNDNRLFFGLRSDASGWFSLPLFAILLTITMIVICVQSWRPKAWPIWKRIYYITLTMAAIVCLLVLNNWGMLTALVDRTINSILS